MDATEFTSLLNVLSEVPHNLIFSVLLREMRSRNIRLDVRYVLEENILTLYVGESVGSINTTTKVLVE